MSNADIVLSALVAALTLLHSVGLFILKDLRDRIARLEDRIIKE